MTQLLKKPLLHCLVIGGLIVYWQWLNRPAPEIFISQQEVSAFNNELIKSFGTSQDIDNSKIIRQLAEDKVLYQQAKLAGFDKLDSVITRLANVADFLQLVPSDSTLDARYQAALAMKLDETDIVVRRQMITLFKTALTNIRLESPPTETDIQAWYTNHPEQYIQTARFAFSHVYLQKADQDKANRLSDQLNQTLLSSNDQKAMIEAAIIEGDVFYGGHHFNLQNQRQIARHFGQSFAEKISAVSLETWSQPIASAFGLHIVWLADMTAAMPKPLTEVRLSIERELTMKAQQQQLRARVELLLSQYQILLEDASGNYQDYQLAPSTIVKPSTIDKTEATAKMASDL